MISSWMIRLCGGKVLLNGVPKKHRESCFIQESGDALKKAEFVEALKHVGLKPEVFQAFLSGKGRGEGPGTRLAMMLTKHGTHPLLRSADEANDLHTGAPALELSHPVGQGGLWDNDHVGARHVSHQRHVTQERYGLQCLPKTLTK